MTSETPLFRHLIESVRSNFLRLNIANKLLLGFSALLILLVVVLAYALTNLNQLNQLNESIIQTDIPVVLAADKMIDLVLAEELYIKRYMVFRTSDVLDIYQARQRQFNAQLDSIRLLPEQRDFPVVDIAMLHDSYTALLMDGASATEVTSPSMNEEHENNIRVIQEDLISAIKEMRMEAKLDQDDKTARTVQIGSIAFKAATVLASLGLFLSLLPALIITRNISGAIRKLNHATSRIAEGDFDYRPNISNTDELGDLAEAFGAMADRLQHLEQMSLDTSPLTRLPGGTTIENVLEQRIDADQQIAFCMMDLDNFKAYNDHYGYSKGNEVIQHTAEVIKEEVAKHGTGDDFIGHIGGDDFVVITTPAASGTICQGVVENFDASIPEFYTAEDRERGHIAGKNRQGDEVVFPLASISIAVVTNEKRQLNHIQFGELSAEMKKKAKSEAGSVCLVDRRYIPQEDGSK